MNVVDVVGSYKFLQAAKILIDALDTFKRLETAFIEEFGQEEYDRLVVNSD